MSFSKRDDAEDYFTEKLFTGYVSKGHHIDPDM